MASNIVFNILAETKKAAKSIQDFQSSTSKSIASIEGSFNVLKGVAAATVAVLAGREIVQGLKATIDAASEKEQVLQSLNTALALTGDFSKEASQDIQDFADNIQRTTKFDGDAVLSQVALAKSFGVTNDQAKKLVQAAADLSVATGRTLEQSVEELGKTLQGTTGQLGKTIPGLKSLTQEALKSGEAIDFIAKRFGGAAESSLQTFDGTLAQLSFTFGDLAEEIGNVIVKNPVVIASIRAVTDVVGLLTEYFKDSGPAIQEFIGDAIKLAFNAIPYLVDGFEILGKTVLFFREILLKVSLTFVSFMATFYEFEFVQKFMSTYIDILVTSFTGLVAVLSTVLEAFSYLTGTEKFINPITEALDKLGVAAAGLEGSDAVDGFRKGLDSVGKGLAESLDGSDALFKSFSEGAASARKYASDMAKNISGVSAQTKDATEQFEKLNAAAQAGQDNPLTIGVAFDGVKEFLESALSPASITNAFEAVIDALNPNNLQSTFESIKGVFSVDNIKTSFKGAVDSIRNIKFADVGSALQKAGSVIASGIEGAAQGFAGIFGGGFVNQFSSIIQTVGNMPAALKAAFDNLDGIINGLLESLPTVIKSLLESIPKVAESFAKNFPKLVNMLVNAFPKIADALVSALPKVLQAILDSIPKIIDMIPKIVDKFAQAIPGLLRQILQALPAIINALARAIPQIVRSLAAAIPEIIVVFAQNIAPIVLALVQGILEAIPQIVLELVDVFIVKGGIFKIVGALIQAMPQIAIALVQGIVRAAFNSTGALGSFLGKAFSSAIKFPKFDMGEARDFLSGKLFANKFKENFVGIRDFLSGKTFGDAIKKLFDKFIEQIKGVLSGGLNKGGSGGVGGVLNRASGGAIKLAEGGQAFRVPNGFPGDTFPAQLTSGELVVDRSTASKLKNFLDGDGAKQNTSSLLTQIAEMMEARPIMVNLSIGEQQLASAVFNARRRGYRI